MAKSAVLLFLVEVGRSKERNIRATEYLLYMSLGA